MWVMGQPVTGNGTNQYIVYEFLLAFHNNFGPISYHCRGKASYWSKIAIFSYPTCIRRSLYGVDPRGENMQFEDKLILSIQYTNVTDTRQTDGQTPHDGIGRAYIYAGIARQKRSQLSWQNFKCGSAVDPRSKKPRSDASECWQSAWGEVCCA